MEISSLYQIFQQHPQVTTDSRHCPDGSIFFALKGASFDGNAFAETALEKGCAYAVIDNKAYADDSDQRLILVDNVLQTLQQLANYHRRQLKTPIIGITGTNGKTTTKELIAHVLMRKYRVLYTQGNLNNQIGVPLTLLNLTLEHEIAVIEMGANHPGDIRELVEIVEPDYGIITNVGKAHLEGFGSFEGVVRTKGELYDFLRNRPHGTVFLHQDNPHLARMAGCLSTVRYGTYHKEANDDSVVYGEVLECAPFLDFHWKQGGGEWHEVHTHLIGAYNVDNMLAAVCIGLFFDVPVLQIDKALTDYVPTNNRSQLEHTQHNHLIIDAYNANPTSMAAALNNFHLMKVSPKMLILGAMKELGKQSEIEHEAIIRLIEQFCFEKVYLVGEEFASIPSGIPCFRNVEELTISLKEHPVQGYYILIKGSNSMHLPAVVPYL